MRKAVKRLSGVSVRQGASDDVHSFSVHVATRYSYFLYFDVFKAWILLKELCLLGYTGCEANALPGGSDVDRYLRA